MSATARPIPLALSYALIRRFHAPAFAVMVATKSIEDALKAKGFHEYPALVARRRYGLVPASRQVFPDIPPADLHVSSAASQWKRTWKPS